MPCIACQALETILAQTTRKKTTNTRTASWLDEIGNMQLTSFHQGFHYLAAVTSMAAQQKIQQLVIFVVQRTCNFSGVSVCQYFFTE
jgi:hypothetical protein